MKASNIRILVVDDEQGLRDLLSLELSDKGYCVLTACDGQDAIEQVKHDKFHIMISDVKMPRVDGLETLQAIKGIDPDAEVVMTTGVGTIETAVEAMKKGAYDFIQKPYSMDQVHVIINRAIEKRRLKTEVSELKTVLATVSNEIRTPLNAIMDVAQQLSRTSLNEDQKKYIDSLKHGGDMLLNFINDIFDLSKDFQKNQMD